MSRLVECPGCMRHVRADEGRCPFCRRPSSTTGAPGRMLVLALPLTLMACTGNEPAKPSPGPEPAPVVTAPPEAHTPTPADGGSTPQPSQPADGGDGADPVPEIDERIMVTKYGGPPAMDEPAPTPTPAMDDGAAVADGPADEAEPTVIERQPRKYGAAPRPDMRAEKKYGAPPKPQRLDPS